MKEVDIDQIMKALKVVLSESKRYNLHEPLFQGNEISYVKECIDSTWVSSVGKFVDQFEEMLAEYTGVRKVVSVVNGTAALHISLILAGVTTDDEVLMPTLTFVATANAVNYCNAVPHFVDSCETTLGLDPIKLRSYLKDIVETRSGASFNKYSGRKIQAVLPMHTFGHPVDLDLLLEVCNEFNLVLVEDAAESLGSYYKGRHTGNHGVISALSFNGNKIITTGGGGAILTNDEVLGKKAKHLTTTARVAHKWSFVHDQVGYNYRLPNLNAALGCAQMEKLPELLSRKRLLAEKYFQVFKGISGVNFFREPEFAQSNYWLNVLLLEKGFESSRDLVLEATNRADIMTRPAWRLMHELDIYKNCPRMDDLSSSISIEQRLINIPSSSFLS